VPVGTVLRRPAWDGEASDARAVGALEELSFLGVGFVSLNEGIDPQRPQDGSRWPTWARSRNSERERIAERVKAGLQRASSPWQKPFRP